MSKIPTADVVEVRRGKWIKRGNEKKCSECKFIYYSNNDEWNFCPNCGADMRGKNDNTKR
jgi:rRNA maturation endonuclease Nob1